MKIYTIGHSTHSFDELVEILDSYDVEQLIDIRTVPRSRHTPQFNEHSLVQTLPPKGISYNHLSKVGGLRHSSKESINTGWHNKSFRGYADYMQTDEFSEGIKNLEDLASEKITAIMCAEAVPWRCHRSMVGDALLVRGHEVIDIYSKTNSKPEKLTSFAKVDSDTITYPPED